ncbi:unnamed protein product [Vitrella brassicaformis CCMP3155]|uniref:Uncharacterized protein n=1 Tax=Vitrella brassicaformis (strain CCMP3155) TaxID=1169540 RepID=A0A0G4GX77_VITBC|nr:unnamed protein product [Vitrella brassicaformis CCMP3155]|eukprot:CEM35672.1 unnamed protein product [Vitrella brassicaformis CCMP3155]
MLVCESDDYDNGGPAKAHLDTGSPLLAQSSGRSTAAPGPSIVHASSCLNPIIEDHPRVTNINPHTGQQFQLQLVHLCLTCQRRDMNDCHLKAQLKNYSDHIRYLEEERAFWDAQREERNRLAEYEQGKIYGGRP